MIYDYTNILMAISSYNFSWSYCDSLFHYGFDPCQACYPSQLPFFKNHLKALIMLEMLCLSKSYNSIYRGSEKHSQIFISTLRLKLTTNTLQIFTNLYRSFLQESMAMNSVMDWIFLPTPSQLICWNSTFPMWWH